MNISPCLRNQLSSELRYHAVSYLIFSILAITAIALSTQNLQLKDLKGIGHLGSNLLLGVGGGIVLLEVIIACIRAHLNKKIELNNLQRLAANRTVDVSEQTNTVATPFSAIQDVSQQTLMTQDVQAQLRAGLPDFNEVQLIAKLEQLKGDIYLGNDSEEIRWYSRNGYGVFGLYQFPKLVFKTLILCGQGSHPVSVKHRFENMLKAKEVCLSNGLDLLIIPSAKTIEAAIGRQHHIQKTKLILEREQEILHGDEAQRDHYHNLNGLDETIQQLAIFIAKTGLSDVTWRNIPIIDSALNFQGRRRVALIDLEHMGNPEKGIYGRGDVPGLLGCVAEKHQQLVLKQAQSLGIQSK